MIENTGATLEHFIETWDKEIVAYVKRYKDNMASRNLMDVRYVGAETAVDVVTSYNRTGPGAQITAKGSVPKSISVSGSDTKHTLYQITVAFNMSEKDLKLDPTRYNRTVDMALREIHRCEDDVFINGDSHVGLTGLVTAAQANSNGKIVNSGAAGNDNNNVGAWAGEADTDIYDDLLTAKGKFDSEFSMNRLLGEPQDLNYLFRLDAKRNPYYELSGPLFGKAKGSIDWTFPTEHLSRNKVYATAKDMMAGELVVSENPSIAVLYNGGLGPGRNYYFEVGEWVVPEFHSNDAYVEIDIT